MKKLLLAAVAVAALSMGGSAALAADMPAYKAPMPTWSWAGVYIGGHFGGGWRRNNLTNTASGASAATWPDLIRDQGISFDQNGPVGGAHIGINFQQGTWVYGVELAGSWARIRGGAGTSAGPFNPFGDDAFEFNVRSLFLATARIGGAVDRGLLYVKGGYAGAHVRTSVVDAACPAGAPALCGSGSDSGWRSGLTVGGGWEHAIFDNWIVGVEYNYVRLFGDRTVNLGNGTAIYTFAEDENARSLHLMLVRASYKFGGPVYAKY